MNRLLVATLSIGALTLGAANAADIPAKAPRAVGPAFVCAAQKFQGVNIGIHGGSVYHDARRQDTDGFLTDNAGWTMSDWGYHAGGQLGWNWATCSTIWGFEVDGSWVGGTKNFLPDNPNGGAAPGDGIHTRVDALFTARLRSGVALDNLLLYATGGFAGARFRTSWVDAPDTAEFRNWRWGWTAGVGTEWSWTGNWSIKAETLYVGFMDKDHDATFGAATFRFVHSDAIWVSRIGLNYRFGGAAARY